MRIEFDHEKDTANLAKHGVSLALASELEWESALVWADARKLYGEARQCALALRDNRVYFAAFVIRAGVRRMISLRKANEREVRRYAQDD
jgi:uncharacterized DUF497 family protein